MALKVTEKPKTIHLFKEMENWKEEGNENMTCDLAIDLVQGLALGTRRLPAVL